MLVERRQQQGPPSSSSRTGKSPSGTGKGPSGTGNGPARPAEATGFADGGEADVMAPGPELASLVTAITGPGGGGPGHADLRGDFRSARRGAAARGMGGAGGAGRGCVPGRARRLGRRPGQGVRARAQCEEDGGACQDAQERNGRGGGRGGWVVNPVLVIPWDPALGRPSGPADLPGYGLIDQDDTMDVLRAAGQHPASRWCLTFTGPDGTAAAHACTPGRRTPDDITTATQASGTAGTGAAGLAAALKAGLEPVARVRSGARRTRLPAQLQASPSSHGPQRPVHRPWLRPPRGELRPGP